jgi:cation transport regulator ChaC
MGGAAAEAGKRLMLHFAYGSNMHRGVMRKHAPAAVPIGPARLANYRFVITSDGYASVEPARAQSVNGVIWRLTARDRVTLDHWESIAAGLYRAETLAVETAGRHVAALVYIARPRPAGTPKPGYMEVVVAAAHEWNMPADYITALEAWLPKRSLGAGYRKLGEFA